MERDSIYQNPGSDEEFNLRVMGTASYLQQLRTILRITFLQRIRAPTFLLEALLPILFLIFVCIFGAKLNTTTDELKNPTTVGIVPFAAIGGVSPNFGMIPKTSESEQFVDLLNTISPIPFKNNVTYFTSAAECLHFISKNRKVDDRFYSTELVTNSSDVQISISSNGMTLGSLPYLIQNVASAFFAVKNKMPIDLAKNIFFDYKMFPHKSTFTIDEDTALYVSIFSTVQPVSSLLNTGIYFGQEAETGLRDLLTFFGLSCFVNEIRWFIVTFVFVFVTTIPYMIAVSILIKINFGLVFIYYFLSSTAFSSFLLFLMSLWPSTKMGNIAGYGFLISFFVLIFLAYFTFLFEEGNLVLKYFLSCFFPHGCSAYTLAQMACGAVRSFSDVNEGKTEYFPVRNGLIILTCQTIVFYLLHVLFSRIKSRLWFPAPIKWRNSLQFNKNRLITPENNDSSIIVSDIYKIYNKDKSNEVVALNGVSFDACEGETIAIVGPNGAGKSTLINILSGTKVPTSGEVYFNGVNIVENIETMHQLVGFCPQENIFVGQLTAEEWVRAVCELRNEPDFDFTDIFKTLGLTDENAQRRLGQMSGGNQRKACLAAALVCNPPIVVLDEATSGVDFTSRTRIWSIISSLNSKKANDSSCNNTTVIMATHTLEECEKIADKIIVVVGGRIHENATPTKLRETYKCGYVIECDEDDFEQLDAAVREVSDITPSYVHSDSETNHENRRVKLLVPADKDECLSNLLSRFDFKYILSIQSLEEQIFKEIQKHEMADNQEPSSFDRVDDSCPPV